MKRLSFILAAIALIGTVPARAGEEKVAFPAYQTHVLYDVLDQPDIKRDSGSFHKLRGAQEYQTRPALPEWNSAQLADFQSASE
jgi:hypothetical protein